MSSDDPFGLRDALQRSTALVRSMQPDRKPVPDPCLCGSTDERGRIIAEPVDLTGEDIAVKRNDGWRQCRACAHGIDHGAMCVIRYFGATTTVRDHYHPECTRL